LFFFTSGTFVVAFNPVSASELVEDSWNTKASMNYARGFLGVVAVDGQIYAIGGSTAYLSGLTFVGANERYDPVTDTWTTLASMPTPRSRFAIAACQGKIYCMGNGPTEVYDIATDSWSTKAHAPFITGSTVVVNEQLFVVVTSNVFMYDPATDVWANKTSMPEHSLQNTYNSFVVDNKVVVSDNKKVMIYDPKTDVWYEETTKYQNFNGVTGVTTGVYAPQKLYAIWGWYDYVRFSIVNNVYDPLSGDMSSGKVMSIPRWKFGVVVLDDLLYAIGGYDFENACSIVEQYVPIGYDGTIHTPEPSNPTTSPPVTPNPSDTFASSEPEPPKTSGPFLTGFVVTALVLVVVLVFAGVFLYFQRRGKLNREKIEHTTL
ncbi:MAG: hypothetical protein FWG55_00620, partial [Candidatus Bathyarchaeota archaeon]|nr:hypothetical protein [Candidatus Termiticorpusculum sp.]